MRRAGGLIDERFDREAFAVEVNLDNATGWVRRAECAAFADLGAVPGRTRMLTARQRQSRYDRCICRASGNHDVRAGTECCLNLLGTSQRNDVAHGSKYL